MIPARILDWAKLVETLNHSEVAVSIKVINQTKNLISLSCFRVLIIQNLQIASKTSKEWNAPFVKKNFQVMLKFFNCRAILNTSSTLNASKTG